MSWLEVRPEGDPVRGDIGEFEQAVTQWRAAKDHGYKVRDEFRSIIGGCTEVGLEGAAAKALVSIVQDAQSVLDDVPEVFGSLEALLRGHLARLRELKAAADAALARAKVAQAERRAAASQQAATNARLATLQRQVNQLRALPPEQAGGQLIVLERQTASEVAVRDQRRRSLATIDGRLQAEHTNWQRLRDQEDDLNRATASALWDFELRSLRDPGNLEKAWGAATGFFGDVTDNLINLGKAIVAGDFEQALWHYRQALDHMITVLSVVAVVVAVVAIAIGGIATGGGLLLAIGGLIAVLATVKFGATLGIFATKSTNKETGERLDGADVVADGLSAAMAIATFGKASALKATGVNRPVMFRHLAEEQSHIVMKNFGQISWKGTATRVLEKDVLENPQVWRAGHDMLANEGEPVADPRRAAIDADIAAMRSGQRGLTAPVQTICLPSF
jgi:hypothetical protein